MKKLLFTLLLVTGALSITLIYSCKKKDATTTTPSKLDSNDQTSNDDANYYKSENDNLNSDVNTDLGNYSSLQGRMSGGPAFLSAAHPCGCSNPDTSNLHSVIPTVVYHFDGTSNCWGRHRSGTVTVQLTSGTRWSDAGAVLTFSTTDYTVTRIYDNKSITFNGTKTLKNVNGSNLGTFLYFLAGDTTYKFQDRALGVQVTFNGGLHATWNTAYTTQYKYNPINQLVYFTASGDTSTGGYSNVYEWGTDRFSQQFYCHTGVGNPIVCNSTCGYGEPTSGAATLNVNNSSLTITFGVNSDGSTYTGSGCPWGYNVAWQLNNGNNGTESFQYY